MEGGAEVKPDQQRIAIAEACGWKIEKACGTWIGKPLGEQGPMDEILDYLDDLNAMHEAEKVLTGYQQTVTYSDNLMKIVGYHTFDSAHATAAQRAEAFLRTIGKWEEARK